MANHYLFNKNTSDALSQIIDDKDKEFENLEILPLNENGNIVYHFALDAHEIGEYCFPIDIHKTYKRNGVEKIVDSQIAYYDVFQKHHSKPIIFEEYEDEVKQTFEYFRSFNDNVRKNSMELLQTAFFSNIENISNLSGDAENTDFQVAFKLALLSFGVERLIQIYPKRIDSETKFTQSDLLDALKDYQSSNSAINAVCNEVRNNTPIKSYRTLERDVISIDKVNFLNNCFLRDSINQRMIYFSSAARTEHILNAFKKNKSKTNYCDFNPWRTPIQIYLYLMLRELDEENRILTKKTIERLKNVREWFIELDKLDDYPINPKKAFEFESLLETQKNIYIQSLDSVESFQLGSIASLYELGSNQNKININRSINKYFSNDKEKVHQFVDRIDKKGKATEIEIDDLLKQTEITLKLSDVMPLKFAGNDDIFTNCYDAFPFLLFIKNEDYISILNDLYDYWFEYYEITQLGNTEEFDKNRIITILNKFISLDIELTARDPEYYTVSAMLHLINSNKDSDRIAKDYIKKLEKFNKIENDSNLLYIKASVLRRNDNFEESIFLCDQYKNEDFRFGYCRALALIELVYESDHKFQENKDKIDEAINDLINAFEEMEKSLFNNKSDFQAAMCSNIIYLASLYYHHSDQEKHLHLPSKSWHVETAEKYLEKLKELKPKEEWNILFPDFYHSEAFFEYTALEAYISDKQSDEFSILPKQSWEATLNSAIEDINKAIEFSIPKKKTEFYADLKEKLEYLLKQL